jgi:SAM-dependent methyltransferase
MTSTQQYWDSVYQERDHELVGWYQANPTRSLRLLRECGVSPDAPIVNIGGGSSVLVDRLIDEGYTDVTVLDLSATALAVAQERLGPRSALVTWIEADVTEYHFDRAFQVWHDRAALHFLIDTASQRRYVERLRSAVPAGGHVIVAAFAPDGPESCSGLPVKRYSQDSLSRTLGADFAAVTFENETHRTPGGSAQEFLYAHFQRRG